MRSRSGLVRVAPRRKSGGQTFLTDALGLTVGNMNSSGSISGSYTPFGKVTASGTNASPYQFTGRESNGTGLDYYRARYYQPAYQRFIAQDPIGFHGGDVNLYAAMANDPVDHTDPLGPWWLVFPDSGGIYKLPQNFNQYPSRVSSGLPLNSA